MRQSVSIEALSLAGFLPSEECKGHDGEVDELRCSDLSLVRFVQNPENAALTKLTNQFRDNGSVVADL